MRVHFAYACFLEFSVTSLNLDAAADQRLDAVVPVSSDLDVELAGRRGVVVLDVALLSVALPASAAPAATVVFRNARRDSIV
jgi:hypothetical protein